jgi:hypothetical protein
VSSTDGSGTAYPPSWNWEPNVRFAQEAGELPFDARRLMCETGIVGESAHVRLESVSWGCAIK